MNPNPINFHIRPYQQSDLYNLKMVEFSASQNFSNTPFPELARKKPVSLKGLEKLILGNFVSVACDEKNKPIGFAAARAIEDTFYLKEISVHPDFGQQGIGVALLTSIVKQAKSENYRLLALSTFKDVPFNAPFYERNGFIEMKLSEAKQSLTDQFYAEIPENVDSSTRILMTKAL